MHIYERFNGGWVAEYIVDWLKHSMMAKPMTRESRITIYRAANGMGWIYAF